MDAFSMTVNMLESWEAVTCCPAPDLSLANSAPIIPYARANAVILSTWPEPVFTGPMVGSPSVIIHPLRAAPVKSSPGLWLSGPLGP